MLEFFIFLILGYTDLFVFNSKDNQIVLYKVVIGYFSEKNYIFFFDYNRNMHFRFID